MAAASILVADDDAVARELLVEVLTREGYRVRAARGRAHPVPLAGEDLDQQLAGHRVVVGD